MDIANKLKSAMEAFHIATNVPVTYFSSDMDIIWECGKDQKICNLLDSYNREGSSCMTSLRSALKTSQTMGDPYVFVCSCGLIQISLPYFVSGKVLGYWIAGPIALGQVQESLIDKIMSSNNYAYGLTNKLILFIRNMKTYPPQQVSALSNLFSCCLMASIEDSHHIVLPKLG